MGKGAIARALGRLLHIGGRAVVKTIPTVARGIRPVANGVTRAWRKPASAAFRRTGGVRALERNNIRGIKSSATTAKTSTRLRPGNIQRTARREIDVAARQPVVRAAIGRTIRHTKKHCPSTKTFW